jgi:hypothetical protein
MSAPRERAFRGEIVHLVGDPLADGERACEHWRAAAMRASCCANGPPTGRSSTCPAG